MASICNFKCFYCIHSNPVLIPETIRNTRYMSFDIFKRCADNILKLGTLKKVVLSGTGEPMINPDLIRIVEYAQKIQLAQNGEIELISNASLLTNELADGLIQAGLGKLKISLQGLNSQDYLDTSCACLDFDKFIGQIEYFYRHKKNTVLRIKIMDSMINTSQTRETFYNIFGPICDELVVENIKPIHSKVDYSRISERDRDKNFYNEPILDNQICTRPFFSLSVWTDGSIGQCSNVETLNDITFGNAADDFDGVWNGEKYNAFLLSLLRKDNFTRYATCSRCKEYQCMALPSDILDGHEEELIRRYEQKLVDIAQKKL